MNEDHKITGERVAGGEFRGAVSNREILNVLNEINKKLTAIERYVEQPNWRQVK